MCCTDNFCLFLKYGQFEVALKNLNVIDRPISSFRVATARARRKCSICCEPVACDKQTSRLGLPLHNKLTHQQQSQTVGDLKLNPVMSALTFRNPGMP